MSFFKKLKNKLFKSSSRLEEGIDAIVEDGGEEEIVELEAPHVPEGPTPEELAAEAKATAEAEEAEKQRLASLEAERSRIEAERLEAERLAAKKAEAARIEAERLEAERLEAERAETARLAAAQAEAERAEAERQERERIEAERQAAEKEALAKAAAESEALAKEQAERIAAEQAERARLEAERLEAEGAEKQRLEAERQEQLRKEEAERQERERLEQERILAAREEEARLAQEKAERLAQEEAAREAAEQERRDQETRDQMKAEADAVAAAAAALAASEPEEETSSKPGIFGRLLGRKEQKTVVRRALDDDMLEALEELLIASDMGVDTALRVTANMAEGRMGKKLSTGEIKQLLADEIAAIMEPVAKPMPLYPNRPQVVLVVGVNGSGKTTTIGKLALQFQNAGKKVVIAAGDTFRAAAVEQLQVWGDRAGVPVLTAPEGSDPASLAFDAMAKAEADGADLLMIDTAGRLQNRADLMEELAKIVRVIRKKDESAPHNTLLVLDATTGQNALNQVDIFRQIADVSGLVMTKLDGTAKGGVLVALADKFGLPIHAIGVGEQIDDLDAFDPKEFAEALTGVAVG